MDKITNQSTQNTHGNNSIVIIFNDVTRMLLNEVLAEGSAPQKSEAQELMQQIT